jgi:hypothetical protein
MCKTFAGQFRKYVLDFCWSVTSDSYIQVDIYGSGVFYFLLHNPRSGDTTQILTDLQRLEQKVKADCLLKTDELFHEWSGDFDLLKVMVDPKPENRVTAKELLVSCMHGFIVICNFNGLLTLFDPKIFCRTCWLPES